MDSSDESSVGNQSEPMADVVSDEIRRRLFDAVAHDLSGSLTGVRAVLESLAWELRSEANRSGRTKELVAEAIHRVEDGRRLLKCYDLLANGHPGREQKSFDVSKVVKREVDRIRAYERAAHTEVVFHRRGDESRIVGDWTLLAIAVSGLLQNAVRHSVSRKRDITSPVEVFLNIGSDKAAIRVMHYGEGIPEDLWEHVFDITRPERSVWGGLDLSVARAAIRTMGGTVSIEKSEPRGVTSLLIRLPLGQASTDVIDAGSEGDQEAEA